MGVFVIADVEDIFALMFADDISSARDTIIRLQRQIHLIEIVCKSVGMTLNLLKIEMVAL